MGLARRLTLAPARRARDHGRVLGAIVIVIVCCIAIPVAVLMSGAVLAAVIGWLVQTDVEAVHAGSELVELNR